MNEFSITTGKWTNDAGEVFGIGYSGGNCGLVPAAVNNTGYEMIPNVGPLPEGFYTIGPPEDTVTHGPFVLPLTPDPENVMYGRSGFLVHGDSVLYPGQRKASDGCIVLDRATREAIWASNDRDLHVTS
jgi:hypothetical protein